jgi:hypothetical protein
MVRDVRSCSRKRTDILLPQTIGRQRLIVVVTELVAEFLRSVGASIPRVLVSTTLQHHMPDNLPSGQYCECCLMSA